MQRAKPTPSSSGLADAAAQRQALAERRLQDASVRVTAARVRVLCALLEAQSASSHQDVQDRLADMDRVTLYRALDCLTNAGIAHKIAGDDRVFRYSAGADVADPVQPHAAGNDTAISQHQHGHFKCTRCARVFCLDNGSDAQPALRKRLQDVLQKTLGDGFRSHEIELTIKGLCADCAAGAGS